MVADTTHATEKQLFFTNQHAEFASLAANPPAFADCSHLKEEEGVLEDQAAAYNADVTNLQKANVAYQAFETPANTATQGLVGHAALAKSSGFEGQVDFTTLLNDNEGAAIQKEIQDDPAVLSNGGNVTGAAAEVDVLRGTMRTSGMGVAIFCNTKLIASLQNDVKDAKAEKAEIQEKIEKACAIAEGIETLMSVVGTAAAGVEIATDLKEGKEVEFGDGVEMLESEAGLLAKATKFAGEQMNKEQLAKIDGKIAAARSLIASVEKSNLKEGFEKVCGEFEQAKAKYMLALKHFQDLVKDRQMAYDKLGKNAKVVDKKGKQTDDPAIGVVMTFLGSVRENNLSLEIARKAGEACVAETKNTLAAMAHRKGTYVEGPWSMEGSLEHDIDAGGGGDQATVKKMDDLTNKWLAGTKDTSAQLAAEEATAQKFMEKMVAGTKASATY
jgi:hypothetical protein